MRQTTQKLSKEEKKFKIQAKQILWLFCGLLLVGCVFSTIQGASTGAELLVLEKERSRLVAKNRDLSAKLFESTSLMRAEKIAENLGFSEPTGTLYIGEKEPVAKLP